MTEKPPYDQPPPPVRSPFPDDLPPIQYRVDPLDGPVWTFAAEHMPILLARKNDAQALARAFDVALPVVKRMRKFFLRDRIMPELEQYLMPPKPETVAAREALRTMMETTEPGRLDVEALGAALEKLPLPREQINELESKIAEQQAQIDCLTDLLEVVREENAFLREALLRRA